MADTIREHARHVNVLRLSGEVCTKSTPTRKRFTRKLRENLARALQHHGIEATIEMRQGRIDVETDDPGASEILARVFGVHAVVPSVGHPWQTMDDIVELGVARWAGQVEGRRFAVRSRRVGQRAAIPFTSTELNVRLGQALVDAGGRVDLDDPELTVGVEVREGALYLFDHELAGPGGLPLGIEGRALTLISGGFDSAVATWMLLKRGVALDFLFFNLGGSAHERGVREVTKLLCETWTYGSAPTLHVVDFRPVVADMQEKVHGRWWQLLLKRLMMRAADQVAQEGHYPVLVTGEAMGQVSSQTLSNLAAITVPIRTPILRPLIGFNKEEITQLAQRIGTYETSAGTPEFCALEGGRPVTRSSPGELDTNEAKIDLSLLDAVVSRRHIHQVAGMEVDLGADALIERVPDEAVVLDLREQLGEGAWRWEGSVHLPFTRAMDSATLLPADATYVLYCDVGLKSAFLAEAMREKGYEAFSFRGGLRPLRRLAERAG